MRLRKTKKDKKKCFPKLLPKLRNAKLRQSFKILVALVPQKDEDRQVPSKYKMKDNSCLKQNAFAERTPFLEDRKLFRFLENPPLPEPDSKSNPRELKGDEQHDECICPPLEEETEE